MWGMTSYKTKLPSRAVSSMCRATGVSLLGVRGILEETKNLHFADFLHHVFIFRAVLAVSKQGPCVGECSAECYTLCFELWMGLTRSE